MELLFDDSDQYVSGHGAPDLRLHRVLARSQKALDAQVLLDPFEEQLYLPAALVQRGNGQRRQRCVVGQKHQRFARIGVFESDAPKMLWVVLGHVKPVEPNRLIADHTGASVGLGRVNPMGIHAAFGAGHKERAGLMYLEEPVEVHVTPIHHVKRTRFDGQDVEHFDIAHLAIADVDEGRDRPAQVQQRVHLHRRLGAAKRSPIEQAQTQVDGGRVQRVDRRIEFQSRWFCGVEVPGSHDQAHRKRVINVPVPLIQRIRESRSCGYAAQTHVKQLGLIGCQADLDVAQRLAPRQLRECHHAKQIGAVQGAHSRIAAMAVDDAPEGFPRHILHDLRKQRFAHVHTSPQAL